MALGGQNRDQDMAQIALESYGVHGAVEHHGGNGALTGDGRDQGDGAPMAVRGVVQGALAFSSAGMGAGHGGLGAGFVQEDQASGIEPRQGVEPVPPAFGYVGPQLLART